jgi:hypothetical protein
MAVDFQRLIVDHRYTAQDRYRGQSDVAMKAQSDGYLALTSVRPCTEGLRSR